MRSRRFYGLVFLLSSIPLLGCDGGIPTQPDNIEIGTSLALENPSASAIAPGVIAWWTGDGNSIDIVGRSDGTLRNGAGFAPGQVQEAFSVDGVDDFIEGTASALPQGSAPRTYDAWILPHTTATVQTIFNYVTFAFNQRNGMLLYRENLYFVGEFNDVIGRTAIPANEWTHVAVTLSGSSVNMYVNGALDISATLPNERAGDALQNVLG